MQSHLHGYKPGDPFVAEPHPSVAARPAGLPEEVDVLIVGCGPAGLVLATQLAEFPEIRTVVIDRKDGPLKVGQADGVACRTVEMFEAFGLADRLVREGYWVNEVSFWRPDPQERSNIRRAGRVRDTEEDLSKPDEVSDRVIPADRNTIPEKLTNAANRILYPYTLEVRDVEWASVYEIGRRLCDKFDDVPAEDVATRHPRVLIAGDACNTHSAKAGQGMNVSMADTWNLGWKLASVLTGRARPELLHPTPRNARPSPTS